MKKLLLYACCLLTAAAPAIPQSGDKVVIDDYPYVLIHEGDWIDLTNRVAEVVSVHEKMMGTEEGRVAIHGKRGHTVITNGYIEVRYADGYVRRETVKANARKREKRPTLRGAVSHPRKLYEIMRRREEAKTPREVVETVGGAK